MTRSHFRGHKIVFVEGRWIFEDTKKPTKSTWKDRPCGHCGKNNTEHGHDGCLGNLPGVDNACCGHGVRQESYIIFTNGIAIRGFEIERQ